MSKKKKKQIIARWICWLLVITLVFSSIPLEGLAATEQKQEQPGQTNSLTEQEEANRINQEIIKKANTSPVPPAPSINKGELVDKRERNVKVIQNGSGSYSRKVYLDPIHRKDEQNKWQDISTDLMADYANNIIKSKNTKIDVSFEQKPKDGTYATVQKEDHVIQFKVLGAEGDQPFTKATDVTAQYEDNKVWYRNALPNTDLRNVVFDQSIKEDIILNKYEGFHQFHFFVKTSLEAQLEEDGSIIFQDGKGTAIFKIPRPFMSDSNVNALSGEPQTSYKVSYEFKKVESGYTLTVVADKEWLSDTNRVYPVYIDPSIELEASGDTFVASAYPTTNYDSFWESSGGYYSLKVGYYDATTGTNYTYVKPSLPNLAGATINSATFNILTAHSYYPTTATGVWLDRVDGSWSPTTLTWNNKPASVNIASASVYKNQWASFNVLNTVKEWVSGTRPNHGFKLHTNGNGATYWKKFYASENSIDVTPYLSVDYQYPTPPAPTGSLTSNNNGTGYANLSWNAIPGATGYKVWIYNGAYYEPFDVGTSTSWTTKGKGIWPTNDEIEQGRYDLHQDGTGTELATSPASVYENSGTHYGTVRHYYFRISAIFPEGESGFSNAYSSIMPMDVPKATANANPTDPNTGYVGLTWVKDPLATGYKVWIYN